MAKKHFSCLGMGLFVILAVTNVLLQQIVRTLVMSGFFGDSTPSWLSWLCTIVLLYSIALPLGLLIIRKVPATPLKKSSLTAARFTAIALISIFMMFAGILIGKAVTTLLHAVFGSNSLDPFELYNQGESLFFELLVFVILAPLIEEYIFRKQLIDRMNVYGEKLSVFTSALLFALFHGNLSQLFYAFSVGLVFGYVYIKTGNLRYSIVIHMFINFWCGILPSILLKDVNSQAEGIEYYINIIPFAIYGYLILGLVIAGLVMFCFNIRNVRFDAALLELPKGTRLRSVLLNCGMLLLIALCLVLIVTMSIILRR